MKSSLILGVFLAGCAFSDLETVEVEQQLGGNCQDWVCGSNSPVILNHGIDGLWLNHQKSPQGFTFDKFVLNDKLFEMKVKNGVISALGPDGNTVVEGSNLNGAYIYVSWYGQAIYIIRITKVDHTLYWASLGTPQTVEDYLLEWADADANGAPSGKFENLCSHPESPEHMLGMNQYYTVVFEGDQLHADTKTVDPVTDRQWITFGCAGSAPAKLHLTGHTYAASSAGFTTTIDERTTILKMFVGDYCGTGVPFTVAGQPLTWKDDHDWMAISGYPTSTLEARWTVKGAACLNTPRVVAHPTNASEAEFPASLGGVEAAIQGTCPRPPPCTDNSLKNGGYHMISVNP
jgi:ADYC domain-containing protein